VEKVRTQFLSLRQLHPTGFGPQATRSFIDGKHQEKTRQHS
jgi:hypothetical protein